MLSIMAIILIQFISIYSLQIAHVASSCGCIGSVRSSTALGVGFSAGVVPSVIVSVGVSTTSTKLEFCNLNQNKEILEISSDRFELLYASTRADFITENTIV